MHLREFKQAGNPRVLLSAFLYFDVSFMVWVLLGALGVFIAEDLGLNASQKGLVAAVPLLAGSGFRLVLGPLSDHIGSRRAGLIGLTLTALPLLVGWLLANSFADVLLVGLMLGVAGASFAVALPLASRWYPPEHQGLALGIAGAGNSGTVIAALVAPRLAQELGWRPVLGLALIPVLLTMAVFWLLAKDSPHHVAPPSLRTYLGVLRRADTLWLCLLYSVTFGGFVGLASYLGILFRDEYGVSRVRAGDLTAVCVFAGSLLRPVGGALADRLGGLRMLVALLGGIAALLLGMALLPPLWLAVPVLVVLMAMFGMGNGAVFQVIPQIFRREIGVVTGLVGAAGGVGGFYLPTALGALKQTTGGVGYGFVAFACTALAALVLVVLSEKRLRASMRSEHAAGPAPAEAAPAPLHGERVAGSAALGDAAS